MDSMMVLRGVGERRAAKLAEVYVGRAVGDGAEGLGDALGGGEFGCVALAVFDRQGVGVVAFGTGDGEAGGGIEPAGQRDEGVGLGHGFSQNKEVRFGHVNQPWRAGPGALRPHAASAGGVEHRTRGIVPRRRFGDEASAPVRCPR